MNNERIAVLDGLRGVAILLVVAYHYFSRWSDLYPYGDAFSVGPAPYGFVGVHLFFLIAGFVIFRSLERSRSFLHFAAKRADRLVLPMLVISAVTLLLLMGPLANTKWSPTIADLLPSITFSDPKLWTWVDGDIDYVDGVYWTLFVEVRFYALMALIWFAAPRKWTVEILAGVAALSVVAFALLQSAGLDQSAVARGVEALTFPQYIALFACGAVYAQLREGSTAQPRKWLMLVLLIAASLVGLSYTGSSFQEALFIALWCVAFHVIFLSFVTGRAWVGVFAVRPLVFVGLVSYSLFLLHQRIGVSLISRLPEGLGVAGQLAGVIAVFGLMLLTAYISWSMIERRKFFGRLVAPKVQPAFDRATLVHSELVEPDVTDA